MTTYTLNQEHNGIEINFTEKPTEAVRGTLKTFGFRWHATKKVWYAKNTKERLEFAKNMIKQDEHDTALKASETKAEKASTPSAEKKSKTKAEKKSKTKAEKASETKAEKASTPSAEDIAHEAVMSVLNILGISLEDYAKACEDRLTALAEK